MKKKNDRQTSYKQSRQHPLLIKYMNWGLALHHMSLKNTAVNAGKKQQQQQQKRLLILSQITSEHLIQRRDLESHQIW